MTAIPAADHSAALSSDFVHHVSFGNTTYKRWLPVSLLLRACTLQTGLSPGNAPAYFHPGKLLAPPAPPTSCYEPVCFLWLQSFPSIYFGGARDLRSCMLNFMFSHLIRPLVLTYFVLCALFERQPAQMLTFELHMATPLMVHPFLHEHFSTARSWKLNCVEELLKHPAVNIAQGHMCPFRMMSHVDRPEREMGLVKRRIGLMTNSKRIAKEFDRRCDGAAAEECVFMTPAGCSKYT